VSQGFGTYSISSGQFTGIVTGRLSQFASFLDMLRSINAHDGLVTAFDLTIPGFVSRLTSGIIGTVTYDGSNGVVDMGVGRVPFRASLVLSRAFRMRSIAFPGRWRT
jgi:hypothetical protein